MFRSIGLAFAWMLFFGITQNAVSFAQSKSILVEAESFADHGGWVLDTQFIDSMGSPYLLAHGLGQPVADAVTRVKIPANGTYDVYVRTFDWVERWDASGDPGKFGLFINGERLASDLGTRGEDWAWQLGGSTELSEGESRNPPSRYDGFRWSV